ncbi:MAG: hypothetical protein O7J95_07260, partial [Planctomycetota bacterium]|nr:hypothetical protein [Planctomycetota bacterium]
MTRFTTLSKMGLLAVCLGSASLVTGCANFHKAAFNGGKGANGSWVLVVPFRESKKRWWYGESPLGKRLSQGVKSWALREGKEPLIVEGEGVKQLVTALLSWEKDAIHATDWKTLTRHLGVKYVVEGDLEEFSLTDPKTIGIYRSRAVAKFRVVNALTGQVTLPEKTVVATYGSG